MTRWSFRILILFSLGAITAILIALACARWSRPATFAPGMMRNVAEESAEWVLDPRERTSMHAYDVIRLEDMPSATSRARAITALSRRIPRVHDDKPFFDWADCMVVEGKGVLWLKATRTEKFDPGLAGGHHYLMIGSSSAIEKQYGWPRLCLSSGDCALDLVAGKAGLIDWIRVREDLYGRYQGSPSITADSVLNIPRAILLPAFLINTLLYASMWCLVWIGFTSGRRQLRRLRGRCPRCAYDLRGEFSAGCSECGWRRTD